MKNGKPEPENTAPSEEGRDYYFNDHGLMVFTARWHLKRGYCCKNKCLHCPWGFGGKTSEEQDDVD